MQGKIVFITGSTSGIGKASADLFESKGWRVAATSRREPGTKVASDTRLQVYLDTLKPDSFEPALDSVRRHWGDPDVLVNNAGYALMGPLEGWSETQWREQVETNLMAPVRLMQLVLPGMRRKGRGAIVNVTSIGGRIAFPFTSAYHATKFALEGLTEGCRFELSAYGVKVALVEPGGTRTDFVGRGLQWADHPDYQEAVRKAQTGMEWSDRYMYSVAPVAKTVYRAATERNSRLRYLVNHEPLWSLHKLLPDFLWTRMLKSLWKLR